MSTKTTLGVLSTGMIALVLASWSEGQEQDKQKKDDSRTVTKWVAEVKKPGLDPDAWEELDTFDSYEKARIRTQKWSDEHPNDKTRMTREREIHVRIIPPDPGLKDPTSAPKSGANSGTITKPGLKAVSVAGKTAKGKIGAANVTIEFTGSNGKGQFMISGDLTAKGEWREGPMGVEMKFAKSKIELVIRGERLAGLRFIETSKLEPEKKPETIDLNFAKSANDPMSNTKPASIAGTEWRSNVKRELIWRFLSDGQFEWENVGRAEGRGRYMRGTWKEENGEIAIEVTDNDLPTPRKHQYGAKFDGKGIKVWGDPLIINGEVRDYNGGVADFKLVEKKSVLSAKF